MVEAEVTIMGDWISIDSSYVIQQKCSSYVLENMYRHGIADSDFVLECQGEATRMSLPAPLRYSRAC